MPRIGEISRKGSEFIEVPSLPWLNRALNGGFVRGAVYLLAGGPGLGKTTLVNQALGDMASRGRKVLYVSTEQSLGEFKAALERLHARGGPLPNAIVQNFYADDTVDDVDALPKFLTRKVRHCRRGISRRGGDCHRLGSRPRAVVQRDTKIHRVV